MWSRGGVLRAEASLPREVARPVRSSHARHYDCRMRVLLVAPPGAGKSTHGRLLGRAFGVPFISSGDLLRAEIDTGSVVGKEVTELVATGNLVPDELMAELVRRRLTEPEIVEQFVLDGFPRTLPQARSASHWPGAPPLTFTVVLHFVAPEAELARRIHERAAESGRADDTVVIWERRLTEYRRSIEPLLSFYRERGILLEVDVIGTVDVVQSRILHSLNGRGIGVQRSQTA